MLTKKIFSSILIPSAAIVAEAKSDDKESKDGFKCRPSELPIYTPESQTNVPIKEQPTDLKPNLIEKSIGKIRVELFSAIDNVMYYKDKTQDYIVDGISGAQWMVDYLGQDSADPTHKAGAIAVGGLAGLIMGLRGGFFRRTLFTSVGALGMASICYPKEAAEYSTLALQEGRNYATIGYNFLYGVKADDPPLELPTIPTSFSEVWDIFSRNTKEQSVSEPAKVVEEQVIVEQSDDYNNAIDPVAIVTQAHDEASQPECHFSNSSVPNPHEENSKQTLENPNTNP